MSYPSNDSVSLPPSRTGSLRSYCQRCRREHVLLSGNAVSHCGALMNKLERTGCLDFNGPERDRSGCSTDILFGEARGKMFGILEGIDSSGKVVILRAFSGQYNGRWRIPGWVGPLFSPEEWHRINDPAEKQIKAMTAAIYAREAAKTQTPTADVKEAACVQELRRCRKALSRELMQKLHGLYRVPNFRGDERPLSSFYASLSMRGIPTGAGDCCAPKLLNHAIRHGITPTGMAEFYWGRENRAGHRRHGRFYPPCTDKCDLLLGFMLCGYQKPRSAPGKMQ